MQVVGVSSSTSSPARSGGDQIHDAKLEPGLCAAAPRLPECQPGMAAGFTKRSYRGATADLLDALTKAKADRGAGYVGAQEVILHCVDTADRQGASGARYQRPYAVPERLDLLRGPLTGTVRLPAHLDWSGNAVYDLDAPGRVVDLYRAVLIEAAGPQDLYAYLDERVLRRLWALLWLPSQLRRAWEQRFPVLAEISRVTAIA